MNRLFARWFGHSEVPAEPEPEPYLPELPDGYIWDVRPLGSPVFAEVIVQARRETVPEPYGAYTYTDYAKPNRQSINAAARNVAASAWADPDLTAVRERNAHLASIVADYK